MLPNHETAPPPSATLAYSLGAFKLDSSRLPGVDQAKPRRDAEACFSVIEDAVQRVYDFARTSAQHLSALCGLDEDYYLRLIFQRGGFLLPTAEQEPLSSCQFPRCESFVRSWNTILHLEQITLSTTPEILLSFGQNSSRSFGNCRLPNRSYSDRLFRDVATQILHSLGRSLATALRM